MMEPMTKPKYVITNELSHTVVKDHSLFYIKRLLTVFSSDKQQKINK